MSQARYQKRMREKAKQERAAAKRERRAERAEAAAAAAEEEMVEHQAPSQADVIAQLAKLHADFEHSRIDFEEFEAQKLQLMTLLSVD